MEKPKKERGNERTVFEMRYEKMRKLVWYGKMGKWKPKRLAHLLAHLLRERLKIKKKIGKKSTWTVGGLRGEGEYMGFTQILDTHD